ncbi:MAG: hypothetical protein M3426_00440 [Actinomycetota bacterium]|nr:hypothetical protein [Actinomycetota bacterium]
MQRWGPWAQEDLDQLKVDITNYFVAYYAELRRLVSRHESDSLPKWIKGVHLVHTHACKDGVLIAHIYEDKIPPDLPLIFGQDGTPFHFDVYPNALVNDLYSQFIPPRLGGGRFPVLAIPEPGKKFGRYTYLRPLELLYPISAQRYVTEKAEELWARLEYANIEDAVAKGRWRDTFLAMEEADLALQYALDFD